MNTLFDVPIIESPFAMTEETAFVWPPDWRQRLERNLGRPSTARWEPVAYETTRTVPAVIMVGNVCYAHPKVVKALRASPAP